MAEPIPFPIPLNEEAKEEIRDRLNNPLQVAESAAQLGLESENDVDRNRFRAILTSLKRLEQEHKEIFGL